MTTRLIVLCGRAYCNGNCGTCRNARFNPGPPTKPRSLFYGAFRTGLARKRFALRARIEVAHAAALRQEAARSGA